MLIAAPQPSALAPAPVLIADGRLLDRGVGGARDCFHVRLGVGQKYYYFFPLPVTAIWFTPPEEAKEMRPFFWGDDEATEVTRSRTPITD